MTYLNYTEFGVGAHSIVILHGLFGSARNWQSIARVLSDRYHVVVPDLRNHGKSPHFDSMSYHEMADDVIALIDKLGIDNTIIIGHSMGGKVAMTAALSRPDRFDAMVIVDIAPVHYSHDFSPILTAMNQLDLPSIKNRQHAKDILSQKIDNEGVIELVLQNLVYVNREFQWRLHLASITQHIDSILQFPKTLMHQQCFIPVLFVGGSKSNFIQDSHRRHIVQLFPSAQIKIIDNVGHFLHAQKPDAFLNQIDAFMHSLKPDLFN